MMYELTMKNGKHTTGIPLGYGDAMEMAGMIQDISEHYVRRNGTELSFDVKPYLEEMSIEEFEELELLEVNEDGENETV